MAQLTGHSKAKYVTGTCLATSKGAGWRGLLAERWHHSEGDLGAVVPRETEIVVMLEGLLHVRRRGDGQLQHHDAVPGTVWLCPAGIAEDMIHLSAPIQDSVHLYLPAQSLALVCLEEFGIDPAQPRLRYEGGFRDPVIEMIAKAIALELSGGDPLGSVLAETMSAALGVYIIRHYSDAPAPALPPVRGSLDQRRMARVLALMDARLGEDISLADLAREASLSPFHFARCFKAATGQSPHRFLVERRLNRARALLERGMPIAQVSMECGFSSQAHFTLAFRQAHGVTPGAFRAQLG